MKKRLSLICLLGACVLAVSGCSSTLTGTTDLLTAVETTSSESSFTSEDMSTFTLEGTEYTFPLAYDVLTDLGWEVSDYSYTLFANPQEIMDWPEGESLETNFLRMESDQYPGVIMEIYLSNTMGAYGSVDELLNRFESDGVWGISIYPAEDKTFSENYPDLSFKGVTYGSSVDDIISAFGTDYDPTDAQDDRYLYFDMKGMAAYCLFFDVGNDGVYRIYASYG